MSKEFVRYDLPKNWVWTTIGDLGIVASGGTPSTRERRYWNGDIPWITPADLSKYKDKQISIGRSFITKEGLNESSARLLPKGSILFSSRAPVGYVAIAQNEIATNQGFKNLIPTESLFPDYLYYYLKFSKQLAESMASGTTFLELSIKKFAKIPVPIPSLQEQNRIVKKIDDLFTIIERGEEHLKNAQYQLKLYRESMLQKAFTGKLTEKWRNEHHHQHANDITPALKIHRQEYYNDLLSSWQEQVLQWQKNESNDRKPTKPRHLKNYAPLTDEQIKELPELPGSWTWIKLGQISEIVGGVTKGRKLADRKTVMTPYLRVANVQDGYLDLNEVKEIEVLPEDVTKYKLEVGDVLYIEGGDKDKLGRGTIWNNELPTCIHQNHVFKARMINRKINIPEFVAYNSQTQVAKGYFFSNAKQTVNLASINMTVLSELPVPLCSAEEQQEILDQLEMLFTKQ